MTKVPGDEKKVSNNKKGLTFERVFTKAGRHPFDDVQWVRKDAVILDAKGGIKFEQKNVEVPMWWPETTVNIVADKYFRVINGEKENSAKQMILRVATWIADQGEAQGYFSHDERLIFEHELIYLLVNGMFAFNSPVWFNVGTVEKPQCSACFIQSATDSMEEIMSLAKREVMLFKGGSGTGSNLSPLRSSYETLSSGGQPSGPVSFMEGFDAFAGVTKSGGGTRRAAKMVVLNIDHPDILTQKNGKAGFITCKAKAEQLAHDLYSTGKYSAEWNKPGNVYELVPFQNANNSVRVTDDFMNAVVEGKEWTTKAVKSGKEVHKYQARDLWRQIAEAAWFCGDPGIQFDTATNEWHTGKESGRINASNPCQPAWATVLTRDGIRTFADIGVGSEIWSGKQWTKVVRKVATGVKPVYRFYTRAGVFAGTEEHRVISEGRRVEARFAESVDTAMGPISKTALPVDPQTVVDGLVLGDGFIKVCNDGDNHYPLLFVGENDQSYFSDNDVAEYINSALFDKLCHRVKTTLTKEELPKTYLREIPARFLGGDEVQVTSFLRGLYSANGSVVDQRITLKAASFTVISQVQEMLSSLGIRSYYTTNKTNDVEFGNGTYTTKESYDLNISTSRTDFARLIGFIQPYKQEKLQAILGTEPAARGPKTSYGIVSKQLVGEEPVWDIEVEAEEHTYWTGGLLVSNCSEYLYLDDTACNLGSLNLLRFAKGKTFNVKAFKHACEITTTAMEILVSASSYPSKLIEENSHKYRTLGLGYTNLGALLTYWGLPYDSNEGRTVAAGITSLMGGAAQAQSGRLAWVQGPYSEFEKNRACHLEVVEKHLNAAKRIPSTIETAWRDIIDEGLNSWREAHTLGCEVGYRNGQVTVLAPTGTISFLMVADTTGIEPLIEVVFYKKLVGEGVMKLPNMVVEPALYNLGYSSEVIPGIIEHIRTTGDIHSAPGFDGARHSKVFAGALGAHAIKPEAHVDMMAAVQPFLSGGISKTVNMPTDATVEDVSEIYMRAWRSGIKCLAIYRNNCKLSQPASTEMTNAGTSENKLSWGDRKKLPATRHSFNHKFEIGGQEGYVIIGMFPDGTIGEMFVEVAKQGSTLNGIIDAWATAVSIGLQHGVPIKTLIEKFKDMRFEPAGFSHVDGEMKYFKSIVDYIFRFMEHDVIPMAEAMANLLNGSNTTKKEKLESKEVIASHDGPPCSSCGNMTKRSGSCYVCTSCATTTGCS